MGPKKDTASTSKASKAPDKKKDRKFDSCVMYFPRKKQRDDSGLFMFDLMHWIEITKHPSFPTPPGRILRDHKLEDHDRLREYTIPYFLGKRRFDMKAHIFAIVEKGTQNITVNGDFIICNTFAIIILTETKYIVSQALLILVTRLSINNDFISSWNYCCAFKSQAQFLFVTRLFVKLPLVRNKKTYKDIVSQACSVTVTRLSL